MKTRVLLSVVGVVAVVLASSARASDIIILAADLAKPELRADVPTPGRWWLNRSAKD